jgi:cell division protein ZapA
LATERGTIEVEVGGQTYRVVASTGQAELERYARMVDDKLRQLSATPGALHPQAMVLAAIALAHDLERERAERRQVEVRARQMLSTVLERVDAALGSVDEDGNALPPVPAMSQPERQ